MEQKNKLKMRNTKNTVKSFICLVLALAAVGSSDLRCDAGKVITKSEKVAVEQTEKQTSDSQRLYAALKRAVEKGEKEVSLTLQETYSSGKELTDFGSRTLNRLRLAHPEYFLSNDTEFLYYCAPEGKKSQVIFHLIYLNLTKEQKQKMMDKADQIVKEGKKVSKNDVELLQYFRKRICSEVEYDYKAAKHTSTEYEQSYHAYGALMNGKAVCQGYSYALKILCDKAGIPCWVVTGTYREPHAWNYVKIDSQYYQIDLTMDDAKVPAKRSPFFLVGKDVVKGYKLDRNTAPGKLARNSYFLKTESKLK